MKRILAIAAIAMCAVCGNAQTDTYIKLYDSHNRHPRIVSVEYPGDSNWLYVYDSLYGHGGVIENPWVAYRVYIDNRQSLDLYVKQTPQLELDVTGFYTTPEQLQQGYGCDVLWAGKSIGAGSFRGFQGGNPVTIDTVAIRGQRVIDKQTLQAFDKDWIFNGHPIQMKQNYTMKPDSRDLWVEIELEGYQPEDMFCTGIQKLEEHQGGFITAGGVAGSWGRNVPDKNHPELVETVGLGIAVDPVNIVKTQEDELNYLVFVKPDKDGKIRYRVTACGDREKDGFKNMESWFDYVKGL